MCTTGGRSAACRFFSCAFWVRISSCTASRQCDKTRISKRAPPAGALRASSAAPWSLAAAPGARAAAGPCAATSCKRRSKRGDKDVRINYTQHSRSRLPQERLDCTTDRICCNPLRQQTEQHTLLQCVRPVRGDHRIAAKLSQHRVCHRRSRWYLRNQYRDDGVKQRAVTHQEGRLC